MILGDLKMTGVYNDFIKVQWDVDNSLFLCKFGDVTLEASSETKPEFQIQISLATNLCYWGRWEQQEQHSWG